MPRKKRPLDRDGGVVRDASLIVIASEDRYAVQGYFRRFKTRRVRVKVLPTEDTRSSPERVLERIDRFVRDYEIGEEDSFWVCIDRDRWPEDSLREVHACCRRKKYGYALSNPCFELWILLHFEEIAPTDALTCEDVAARLKALLGGYTKRSCHALTLAEEKIVQAVDRARILDSQGDNPLPTTMLTHVYRILDAILEREKNLTLRELN